MDQRADLRNQAECSRKKRDNGRKFQGPAERYKDQAASSRDQRKANVRNRRNVSGKRGQ
jgi:hypothetical protein